MNLPFLALLMASILACSSVGLTTEVPGDAQGDAAGTPDGAVGEGGADSSSVCKVRCGGACVDTEADPTHCGQCGVTCPSLPHSVPSCSRGLCRVSCDRGWADCDGNLTNGCEADLTSAEHCGTCGQICQGGAHQDPQCVGGQCVYTCRAPLLADHWEDCDSDQTRGSSGTGCEVNTSTDVANCGSCGVQCSTRGTTRASCVGGSCLAVCDPPWSNCNGDHRDGCEANLGNDRQNCGSCGQACQTANICQGGQCCLPTVNTPCGGFPGGQCCVGMACSDGLCCKMPRLECSSDGECCSGRCEGDIGLRRCA
jgi:hypothetical protein